jgi:intracellular multiplication protein IcmD
MEGTLMLNARVRSLLSNLFIATLFFVLGTEVWAGSSSGVGLGAIATNVKNNLTAVAQLITAGSYVAGMGFAVGAIAKFKQHKDNPQQMPLSTPIVLLFIGIALIFIPSIFKSGGGTLFGASGSHRGASGFASF